MARGIAASNCPLAERVMDPEIGFYIDRVVLFERNMHRRQRAGHDRLAAAVKGESGPRTPFGDSPGDDHAVRGGLDDPRTGADMGADPRVMRQLVDAAPGGIVGKWGER